MQITSPSGSRPPREVTLPPIVAMLTGCPASSLTATRRRGPPLPAYVTPRRASAWVSHGHQGSLRRRCCGAAARRGYVIEEAHRS